MTQPASRITWIVENFVKERSYVELVDAIKAEGHRLLEISQDGFKQDDLRPVMHGPSILIGSISMVEVIRDAAVSLMAELTYDTLPPSIGYTPLSLFHPTVWLTLPSYRCSWYYARLGRFMFNDRYVILPLNELGRQRWLIYGMLGKEGMIFLRPDEGDKPFQAQLVDMQDLDRFLEVHHDQARELVLVSTPKAIRGEWRYVVTSDRRIVAMSCYQYQGQRTLVPSAPPHVTDLVRKVLDEGECHPDPIYVIDACEDNDGTPWVLELNSFTSAGLYACDKRAVVREATRQLMQSSLLPAPTSSDISLPAWLGELPTLPP